MTVFRLTDKHIKEGSLMPEDFERYAGFPVLTFRLSDFPHWDKLENSIKLSTSEIMERADSIDAAIAAKKSSLPFEKLNTTSLATHRFPVTGSRVMAVERPAPLFEHFETVVNNLGDLDVSPTRYDYERHGEQPYVFPGTLCEDLPTSMAYKKCATVILREKPGDREKSWSRFSYTPAGRLKFHPEEDFFSLYADMHEMRHLPQVQIAGLFRIPDAYICSYYPHLDAEIFARTAFRRAQIGQQTRAAFQHLRYIEFLSAVPECWIAPAIEALENGKYPPNFHDIYKSAVIIRSCLAMATLGEPYAAMTSDKFHTAIDQWLRPWGARNLSENLNPISFIAREEISYLQNRYEEWRTASFSKTPEIFYSLLRELLENGVFAGGLTRDIGQKIIEAAEYFGGEDLTRESNPRSKIKLPEPSF